MLLLRIFTHSIGFVISTWYHIFACDIYLSSKIYLRCFFLESWVIELELLFLHGVISLLYAIRVYGCLSSIELRITSSLLSLSKEELDLSLRDFLVVFFVGCWELLSASSKQYGFSFKYNLESLELSQIEIQVHNSIM